MSTDMMALTDFVFRDTGVRVLGTKQDPWFVAADVFKALNVRGKYLARTLERLDDDEKGVINLRDEEVASPLKLRGENEIIQGSHNTVWIVSEPGLYKIMLRSRTPKAEAFTRFVTHEVLPSIRQYGYYKKPHAPSIEREILNDKGLKYVLANGEAITAAQTRAYCVILGANTVFAYEKSKMTERISYINAAMERRGYSTLAEAHKKWYRLQEA